MYIQNIFKKGLLGLFLLSFFSIFGQTKNFKITLDAGHGGKDWGATYNGHVEKNVSLAVVLKVGKILENQPNIEVNYTRKTDVFIDLIERANIANRVDANIFVSIHCNANKNTVADGTETYVMGMTKNASSLAVAKNENEVITMEKDYKQKYEGYDPKSPETMIGLTLMQEEFMENSISLASKIQDAFKYYVDMKQPTFSKVLIKIGEPKSALNVFPKVWYSPFWTYIVTSGLSTFGLELAHWMIKRGARKIVLTSRTGVRTGYQQRKLEFLQ